MTDTLADARLRRLEDLFHGSAIARTLGMRLHYQRREGAVEAVFDWSYDARFDHILGDVHGGVVATMLDNAGWFATAAHHDTWVVTVEFQVRLLEPAGREDLRAVGRVLRHGRLSTAVMELHSVESARLVATGSGTFAATTKRLPDS